MADTTSSSNASPGTGRGRGRGGRSRGSLGKYLRARGRGHRGGSGRPAEFTPRLVLEGEQRPAELDPEEAEAIRLRYAKRTLVSNADRYEEGGGEGDGGEEEGGGPQLDSDGEEIKEPEVDLSAFLEKQRQSDPTSGLFSATAAGRRESEGGGDEDEEVDHELAHISSQRSSSAIRPKKGRMQTIEWDASLEQMRRDKAVADANRDLKERFRAKAGTLRPKPMAPKERKRENDVIEAPPLPTEGVAKDPKSEMQDFLDDLLG